jgi:hypothetical protein
MLKQKQNIEFIISDEPEIIIDNDEPTIKRKILKMILINNYIQYLSKII